MLGLNSELESSCLPEQLQYIIQFSHAFEYDAVVLPLRPNANRFGGCFCSGSGPVRLFAVVGFLVLLFVWFVLVRMRRYAYLTGGCAFRPNACV